MRLRDRILLLLAESAVPVRSSILTHRLNVSRSQLWARLVYLERAGKVKKYLRKEPVERSTCPHCGAVVCAKGAHGPEAFWEVTK